MEQTPLRIAMILMSMLGSTTVSANTQLNTFIEWAIEHDQGRQQYLHQANSMIATGISQGQLADPKLKFGLGGLPFDDIGLDNDPMTTLSIGLMQQFGRGDTLALKQQQTLEQAEGVHQQATVRQLQITQSINSLWIELYYLQQTSALLNNNKTLLTRLETFSADNYSNGYGHTQDIIQVQLNISKLQDKLHFNKQQQARLKAQLTEWLGEQINDIQNIELPEWIVLEKHSQQISHSIMATLQQHPAIIAIDKQIKSHRTHIEITEEAYKPQFAVEVMYGHRQANGMGGRPASDLFSAFVTVDLPLFTDKRQDKQRDAAIYQLSANQSQKTLILNQMNAKVNSLYVDHTYLAERISDYQNILLRQAKSRTKSIERGYESNTANFDAYLSAAIDEIMINIELLGLQKQWHQINNQLAYLLNKF